MHVADPTNAIRYTHPRTLPPALYPGFVVRSAISRICRKVCNPAVEGNARLLVLSSSEHATPDAISGIDAVPRAGTAGAQNAGMEICNFTTAESSMVEHSGDRHPPGRGGMVPRYKEWPHGKDVRQELTVTGLLNDRHSSCM